MTSQARATRATYDAVADRYLETTRDRGFPYSWLESFAGALSPGARVIDLGSGPGRDAVELRRLGLSPVCVDLSIGMLRAGAVEYPCARVQANMLDLPFPNAFTEGVWASASLLHLSKSDFECTLDEIVRVLGISGRLTLMLKMGAGSSWETERYGKPRWFQYWSAGDLDRALTEAGFEIEATEDWKDSSGPWLIRQCVAAAQQGAEPDAE
jgi:ubiquinone/menaquinone biosynthesis C-methylase UbiE